MGERKKERKSVFEAVGLLTTTNPSCSDCSYVLGRGDDGGGGDGGGDDYGLAKSCPTVYSFSLSGGVYTI
jgi:hypothetical protein